MISYDVSAKGWTIVDNNGRICRLTAMGGLVVLIQCNENPPENNVFLSSFEMLDFVGYILKFEPEFVASTPEIIGALIDAARFAFGPPELDEQTDVETQAAIEKAFHNPEDSVETRMMHAPKCIRALSDSGWECVGWHEFGWNMLTHCKQFCVSVFEHGDYWRATLELCIENPVVPRGRVVAAKANASDPDSAYSALMDSWVGAVSVRALLDLPLATSPSLAN